MSGTRQKIQSVLALEPKSRGETPDCGRQGSEPPVAKPTPENPASAEQLMEEICLLAVLDGQSRRPLAWATEAPHLLPFLGSVERGRFFVPA